jgi:hypothetical protein
MIKIWKGGSNARFFAVIRAATDIDGKTFFIKKQAGSEYIWKV